MSIQSRLRLLLHMKAGRALDSAEDPVEVLDYAYNQQQELLRTLKRGLIEVSTSKHQLAQQIKSLQERVPRLDEQATRAIDSDREDLAKTVLARKHGAVAELQGLERQLQEVAEEERKLTLAQQKLSARIEDFRIHRNVVSARYTAASAHVRVSEALTGVAGELGELSLAVGRAEERAERMLGRASALDALMDVEDLGLGGGGDQVEHELRRLETDRAVEGELLLLRARRTTVAAPSGAHKPARGREEKSRS